MPGMASDLTQVNVQPLHRKPCALEVALGFHDIGLVHPELATVPCVPRIPLCRDMTAEPDLPSLLDSLAEELERFAQRVEVHLKIWCEIAPKPAVLRDPVHQQLRGRTVKFAHRDELRVADHLDAASRADPFARKLGNRATMATLCSRIGSSYAPSRPAEAGRVAGTI